MRKEKGRSERGRESEEEIARRGRIERERERRRRRARARERRGKRWRNKKIRNHITHRQCMDGGRLPHGYNGNTLCLYTC